MGLLYKREDYFKKIETLSLEEEKVTCIALDIDDSKKELGEVLPPEIEKKVIDEIMITFPNFIISKVGRDAFSCAIDSPISVFDLAESKKDLQNNISNLLNDEITFCMGIAQTEDLGKFAGGLFSIAYEALFLAKQKGPDSIFLYKDEPMKLKSLYFRKSQLAQLNQLSNKLGNNESMPIRKALDEFIRKHIN